MQTVTLSRLTLILGIGFVVSASGKDFTAEEGLAKIDKNINTSQANIDGYNDNLKIIMGNIGMLGQTQTQMETQKKGLQGTQKENERILAGHAKEVAKIDGMINKEKSLLEDEKLKIQKLEAMLAQLKGQQDLRAQNILELQTAKDKFVKAKEKGIENQKVIGQSIAEVDKGIQATKKEIQQWNQKKKANEKEVAKWTKEKDNHSKMQEDIKVLMNN